MARVLRDRRLHEFIGGQPLTITELRDGHTRLAAGPAEPDESWLNSSSAPGARATGRSELERRRPVSRRALGAAHHARHDSH